MNLLVTHILRGVQLLFAILVLGLAADACSIFGAGPAPGQDSFMVFCGIWTMLVVLYFILAPRFAAAANHPAIRLALDALTMLFWFAGFIALAVLVSSLAAWENLDVDDPDGYYWGGHHWYQVSAAAAAFGALNWVLFVVTTVFSALELIRGSGSAAARKNEANPELSAGVAA